jgi:PKD repeat protein
MADFFWNFNVGGDGTPPEVQIEYPIAILKSGFDLRQADVYDVSYKDYRMANAGVAYNNVLTVTGNAYDYSGISSVRCKNDANGEITTGSGGSQWSVGVNLVPDSNQNYITVYVKDSNGNEGQDRILVHYSTGGIQLIDIVFNQPTSIGSKGNGAFITDEQFVNVSGHATYTYRNIVKVSWNNNLTGIGGIVWTGSSHDLNWSFNARLKNGENPIWVTVEEEHGGKNYGAFTATSHYMEITTSADPTSVQLFNEVRFASTVDGGAPSFTYEWQFGDSSSSADANPTHTYATTGTFVVSLTVTDSHSTVRNSTVSVTVTTAPTPPQPFDGKQWFVSYGWIIGAVVGFIGAALSFIPVVPKPIKKVGYIFLFAFGVIIGFWILLVSITPI